LKQPHRRHSTRSPRRRLLQGVAVAALALAGAFVTSSSSGSIAGLTPALMAAEQEGRPAAAQKKYRATRPIAADPQGRQRMPTEVEVEEMVASLSTLTRRPESLPVVAGAGGESVDLDGGFAGVMLARLNDDGTYETRCVFTFDEGAEFLGLVEIQ
jgi:hypothetical protein